MGTALIGIGIPASGKTTLLKALAQDTRAVYICPDEIREELCGRAEDQSRNSEVWAETYRRINRARKTELVIIDATNAQPHYREHLVQTCLMHGLRPIGAWFVTPIGECLRRNQARRRQVPEDVVLRMQEMIENEPPSRLEGFDKIIIVIP